MTPTLIGFWNRYRRGRRSASTIQAARDAIFPPSQDFMRVTCPVCLNVKIYSRNHHGLIHAHTKAVACRQEDVPS